MNWFSIIKTSSKEDIFRDLGISDLGFDFLYFEKELFGHPTAGWSVKNTNRTLSALNFMKGIPHVEWKTDGNNGTRTTINAAIYGEVKVGNVTVTTPPMEIRKLGYLIRQSQTCADTTVEKNGISIKICVQSSVSTGQVSHTMPWGDLLGTLALVYHNNGKGVDELAWLMSVAKKEDGSWEALKALLDGAGRKYNTITEVNWKRIAAALITGDDGWIDRYR